METTLPHLDVRREPDIDGDDNMRRDRDMLDACADDDRAVLRLYTWARPTVSLGWMQKAADHLDVDACRRDGIDIVQRPTGGRAILHDEEITYAFASTTRRPPFDSGLQETHRLLASCLQEGLARLGLTVTLSRPTRDPQRRLLQQPCFASAGRAELLLHGRKLLGSAQRRTRQAFLQHGSLLLGPAHLRLVDYLRPGDDPQALELLRQRLRASTTHVGAWLQPLPSFATLCDALEAGFRTRLGMSVA